jgi:DNA repair exonuclease SbcCD ATPase subunit
VGQVWQEEKTLLIDNVPDGYTKIQSGLGQSQPNHLIIVPLIDNKKTYGIIELASFHPFEDYKLDFIQKISESIASTLASAETNEKTQRLLKESQLLTEKMRVQEDEMISNLNELKATQQEIRRREIQKENELKAFNERFNEKIAEHKRNESRLINEIDTLRKKLVKAETDNDAIRELKAELSESKSTFESEISDLEETIKIKEMRIEKFRKKLDKLQGNDE